LKRGEIPSIGELTSFVAAAQHGSFTRAAGELNLTQGAISRQIRELEIHLGIRLFERIRQRVVLTDAGKTYLAQVKKALDDLADATQRVASFSNSTTLNLVALPTFAARWLVPRLPNFQRVNPKIMVHITARQAPIDSALEPFDAAVFHGASHWPGTISQYLMDEDIVAVCSSKLNARRAIKTPADLVEFPLLHKMGKHNRWAEWLADVGIASDCCTATPIRILPWSPKPPWPGWASRCCRTIWSKTISPPKGWRSSPASSSTWPPRII